MDLQGDLLEMAPEYDLENLPSEFIEVAANYTEGQGISYPERREQVCRPRRYANPATGARVVRRRTSGCLRDDGLPSRNGSSIRRTGVAVGTFIGGLAGRRCASLY
jgi:hypothetical protein